MPLLPLLRLPPLCIPLSFSRCSVSRCSVSDRPPRSSRQEALEDEDPEDNFQELCVFALGFSRNLKNTGAAAPAELKGAIAASLAEYWDIKTDSPGEGLREGGVPGLKGGMEALLAGPLAAPEAEPEPEPEDDGEAPADEADAARAARLARQQARPANLGEMSLQEAVTYMWDVLDKPDRVEWGEEGFTLDLQNKGRYGKDRCAAPLFTTVNLEHPFWAHPVTKAFIDLLDNYERETGKREVVTRGEKKEMADFMDALCQTSVIQFLFHYLKVHGKDPRCKKLRTIYDLSSLLYDLWLAPYRRAAANDSSGFEHVFVGEEKRGKITGLHNWVQYYLEEKAGNIDYLGWAGKQDSDYSDDVNLVTVKFSWEDDDDDTPETELKPMSTILCGSTVQFEMAVLSLAFLCGEPNGDNELTLGSEEVKITCYSQRQRCEAPSRSHVSGRFPPRAFP